MGSYNAKPSTSDERDQSVQPTTSSKQTVSNNSHPFTIEDTSDTDGEETHAKNSLKKSPSPVKQIPNSTEAVMQDEQRQRELAQERHREESRAPSGSSGESASPYGHYNPLTAPNGGRPYPPASASPSVTGSGMNPGSLPLLQYPGQPAPPLVAIPTSSAVFSPYPSAFTSPAAAVYTAGLHSSSNPPRPHYGIESYSAMLASMGSQAQQHLQGHLIPAPSYFQGGYIPAQYNPLSPLMAGVIPTSKGMFPEGSYLPTAVGPHVLTGILPSGHLISSAGQHPEAPSEDRGTSSPEKHYAASTRYLEAREQQILESRRLAELQQLSPSGQVHRSIPEARVSPFQQVSSTVAYRVAIPDVGERLDLKGTSPGSSLQNKSVHIPSSKDVMLHTSTPKQVLGGAGDVDSSQQLQLALLPNTFYCGSVPGQAMVATTEGTIRVELPPPTVGINIGSKPGQQMPNPIAMSLPIASSNTSSSGGGIFTFPGISQSGLPPLTSMPSPIAAPSAVPYQPATSRHHSPTYSATVAGLQSWHLTPQVRPTPSVRFQGSSLSPSVVAGSHQDGDQPMSGAPEVHLHPPPGHAETTRTSPSNPQHHPSSHHHHQHHPHHPHHHHHQRHPKATPVATPSSASGVPHHQPTNTLPSYFTRGSIIQLANSVLKRVEDLTTDDFVQSAGNTEGLKIDSSTVLRIDEEPHRGLALIGFLVGEHKAQVTVEAPYEHPFFVFGQGWSSVRPELSLKCYGLQCHTLAVGDVCVSLTVIENGKQGPKEDLLEMEKHHAARMQVQGMSSPEMKRRRIEEKQKTADHHHHAPVIQGYIPGGSSHSSPSPGQQPMEHHPSGGPYEVPDHGIDKNSNIVPDKPLEMPHMKLMRPPKRRWSDPIKANQEAAAAAAAAAEKQQQQQQQGQQLSVAPETLGKVQQQQQQ